MSSKQSDPESLVMEAHERKLYEYVTKLLDGQSSQIENAEDMDEYLSIFIAIMIFKEISLMHFRSYYEEDNKDGNCQDLIDSMQAKADELSKGFFDAITKQTMN